MNKYNKFIFHMCLHIFLLLLLTIVFLKNKKLKEPYDDHTINDPNEYVEPIVFKNFITPDICNQIILKAKNNLFRSKTVSNDKKTHDYDDGRISYQAWLSKDDETVNYIMKRVEYIVDVPIENFESLQVVKYYPGGFYDYHQDACCSNSVGCSNINKLGGHRIYTFIIYLNDDYTGGETSFKNLNLDFKLNKGDAILFHTLDKNKITCHKNGLHSGKPVKKGIKWICNIWVRQKKLI